MAYNKVWKSTCRRVKTRLLANEPKSHHPILGRQDHSSTEQVIFLVPGGVEWIYRASGLSSTGGWRSYTVIVFMGSFHCLHQTPAYGFRFSDLNGHQEWGVFAVKSFVYYPWNSSESSILEAIVFSSPLRHDPSIYVGLIVEFQQGVWHVNKDKSTTNREAPPWTCCFYLWWINLLQICEKYMNLLLICEKYVYTTQLVYLQLVHSQLVRPQFVHPQFFP